MSKIWFTSDFHFCHDKDFIYKPRGFSNVNEMNEAIIENFNIMVHPEDHLYILGDLMLNDNKKGIELINKLPGRKHVIFGNHDTQARIDKYIEEVPSIEDLAWANMVHFNEYTFFLCHYLTHTDNDLTKPLKTQVINLFGHTHQKDNFAENCPLAYHVGVDSHGCCPVELDQIIWALRNRKAQV